MSDKTLEDISLDEFLAHFPPDRIVIPTGWSQIGMAIKNGRFDGWNACLARMTPIIEQRERERLTKEYVLLPKTPTAEILSIIAFPLYPEDRNLGVSWRQELNYNCDVIFPKYEIETAAGQYKRLVGLLDEILAGKLEDGE